MNKQTQKKESEIMAVTGWTTHDHLRTKRKRERMKTETKETKKHIFFQHRINSISKQG